MTNELLNRMLDWHAAVVRFGAESPTAFKYFEQCAALARSPATGEGRGEAVAMKPMTFDDGRQGWYIDTPDFYCDIEPDENGKWSVYFSDRHRNDGGAYASQSGAAPAPSTGPIIGYATHHEPPMFWHTLEEAQLYCDDDDEPIPLVRAGTVPVTELTPEEIARAISAALKEKAGGGV